MVLEKTEYQWMMYKGNVITIEVKTHSGLVGV